MLNASQKRQLEDEVHTFIDTGTPVLQIRELVGLEMARDVGTSHKHAIARWIVRQALVSQTPDLLIKVITECTLSGVLPELQYIRDQLRNDATLWEIPSQATLWLADNKPFVDRDEVREQLNNMANDAGPPVLFIEASKGQGKTSITEYIRELSRKNQGTFLPIEQSFVNETSHLDDLYSLVENLQFALANKELIATTHEEPERQAELMARDVADSALTAQHAVWLTIDGLEPENVAPGVIRFLKELMVNLKQPEISAKLRLVILADSVAIRRMQQAEHSLSLPAVTESCLSSWFNKVLPEQTPHKCSLIAKSIFRNCETQLQKYAEPESKRLERLARLTSRMHQRLIQGHLG